MALKATIHKVRLQLADLDRHHYGDYSLTLARHPSENDARMMVRLLAFARHADERLEFTRGLCVDEEPELWLKNDDGTIALWIETGQPDLKRLRQASGRAGEVVVYSYSGNSAAVWWQQLEAKVSGMKGLQIYDLPQVQVAELASLSDRTMDLQCTIQDGVLYFTNGEQSITVEPVSLL